MQKSPSHGGNFSIVQSSTDKLMVRVDEEKEDD